MSDTNYIPAHCGLSIYVDIVQLLTCLANLHPLESTSRIWLTVPVIHNVVDAALLVTVSALACKHWIFSNSARSKSGTRFYNQALYFPTFDNFSNTHTSVHNNTPAQTIGTQVVDSSRLISQVINYMYLGILVSIITCPICYQHK